MMSFGKWAPFFVMLVMFSSCKKADEAVSGLVTELRPAAAAVPDTDSFAQTQGNKPFGLTQGMTLEELHDKTGGGQDPAGSVGAMQVIVVESVPEPSSDFERYVLYANRDSGLCMIVAYGKELPLASEQETLQQAYQRVADGLKAMYGKPDEESSGLLAAVDRAASLAMDNASHSEPAQSQMTWSPGKRGASSLARIDLAAVSEDWMNGGLLLMYSFANAETCRDSKEK